MSYSSIFLSSFSLAVEEIKTESDAVDKMEVSMPPKGILSLILFLELLSSCFNLTQQTPKIDSDCESTALQLK